MKMVDNTPKSKKNKIKAVEPQIDKESQSTPTVVENKDSDESLLGIGESFSYKTATIKRKSSTSTPAIEPFPKTTVLKIVQVMYEKKQSLPKIKAEKTREGRILSGMLVGEFVNALMQIVPDGYTPKGRNKKNIKAEKPTKWKKEALNEPSIRDKLKVFVADGDVIVFKVAKNRYMYCLTTTFMSIEKYLGSIWHLQQVRNVLFQSSQWVDRTNKKGLRNRFVPNPFFELPLEDLESLLTLSEVIIWQTWDKDKGIFNLKAVKKAIKPVKVGSS